MERLRIGVIGVGRIGRMHVENLVHLVPEAEVVAIADVRREVAERCAAALHIPNAYDDARWILEDPSIDAVVICSSTDTHATFIEQAAEVGKHIFCEKPIALDLSAIDKALAAVNRAGVFLQVGFNRRFDPSFRKLHDLIAEGVLGIPYILRITSRDPKPPPLDYVPSSGGMFLDMTIHDFDMARFLIGDEIETIYAEAAVRIDPRIKEYDDVDIAVITLRFKSGTLGTIDNSRRAPYGYDQRIEVLGSKGMAIVGNKLSDELKVYTTEGVHLACPLYFFPERYKEAFVAEMKDFVRNILKNRQPSVSGEEGRLAALLAHAAKRSLKEGRPVRPSEIGPFNYG